jgi:replicative DNA helicase
MPRDDAKSTGFGFSPWPAADLISADIEESLLGALMLRNRLYEEVVEIVRPGDFGYPVHGRIFTAIGTLIDRGDEASPLTLERLFDKDAALADLGGARYLFDIAKGSVSLLNAPSYARQISELARRRFLVIACQEAIEDAARINLDRPAAAVIEDLDRRMIELADGGTENAPKPIAVAIDAAIASAEQTYKADGRTTGITTGLADLDRKLGGLHAPDLIVIAGRPSMGKTALALVIACAAACVGKQVLVFSLEMSAAQLAARQLAAATGVSAQDQRRGPLSREQMHSLIAARDELAALPLVIDDTAGASVARLRARALRHKRKHGLDLILVDYLQLLQSERTRLENRVQEVSAITLGLKGLAKELHVPVVALSQLSRAVESRDDKRPHLADLRDSGSIEQDADIVIFVYREEHYVERDVPRLHTGESEAAFEVRFEKWRDHLARVRGLADLIIAKNRHGSPDAVKARFDAERTRFENLTTRGEP